MQEQQEDSSELSRSQNTEKPRHQENINKDGKFQETMHMPYNLILKMAIIYQRMLLTWKLNKSRNTSIQRLWKGCYEKDKIGNAPKGYQKIRVHFVFDVKHCGKFKARLMADGHLTKEPNETVYSGVVSLRNLRLAMLFLAELNYLQLWGADVGNAYLQALTKEKLYIVGGPEFEELQGHVLVMHKTLYGTRSGGACWHG